MYKKLLSLLSKKIKLEIFFLFILNCIVAFLEVISISSVPIFLMYMVNPVELANKIPIDNLKVFFENFLNNSDVLGNLKLVLFLLDFSKDTRFFLGVGHLAGGGSRREG